MSAQYGEDRRVGAERLRRRRDRLAAHRVSAIAPESACTQDAHAGPFEPLPGGEGWLGTDWYQCGACRSTISAETAHLARAPGSRDPADNELALWAVAHGVKVRTGLDGLDGQWLWSPSRWKDEDGFYYVAGDGTDLPTLTPELREALRRARASGETADEALRACRRNAE